MVGIVLFVLKYLRPPKSNFSALLSTGMNVFQLSANIVVPEFKDPPSARKMWS